MQIPGRAVQPTAGDSTQIICEPRAGGSHSSTKVFMIDPSCFSLPYDYSLCQSLYRLGSDVTLVCSKFRHGAWDHAATFAVWKPFYPWSHSKTANAGGLLRQMRKGAEHLLSMARFTARLRTLQPNIIHFQWLPAPMLDKLYLRKLAEIAPLVLTVHNTSVAGRAWLVQLQQKLGSRSALEFFNSFIVHTEFSRQKLLEQGLPPQKVHVIPHGALEYYRSLAAAETVPPREHTLLFFGKLARYKGLDILLRAFAQLPAEIKTSTRLTVAGLPGPEKDKMLALVKELKIDARVNFQLRYIVEEEIPGLFRSATAVVLPYRNIDQSGVLMTAIAFDKPVVATQVGGFAEIIQDGVHGYLVPAENVNELSAALAKILVNTERREGMEKQVKALRTGRLSWEDCGRKTQALYESLRIETSA